MNANWWPVAHWQRPAPAIGPSVNCTLEAVAVPVSVVFAEQLWPVIKVWLRLVVPEIASPVEKLTVSAVPPDADQGPALVDPVWVSVNVTASVTVAPATTNVHVPVQVPARLSVCGEGLVVEPPHDPALHTIAIAASAL